MKVGRTGDVINWVGGTLIIYWDSETNHIAKDK